MQRSVQSGPQKLAGHETVDDDDDDGAAVEVVVVVDKVDAVSVVDC